MGQAESAVPSSGNVDLDSVARNAVVQAAVQGMIDAAVQNVASIMEERVKTRIRELEGEVVQAVQTLERTISNMRQQKTATEMKMKQLEESVEKLEKRVGAMEISINTIKMIIPEAKSLVESILKQTKATREVPTPRVDILSEAANVTISTSSSSTPAMSLSCDGVTTHSDSDSMPASTASGCTNPACLRKSSSSDPKDQSNGTLPFCEPTPTSKTKFSNHALLLTTPSSAPATMIQTNGTVPVTESTPTSKTTFSSVRPNPTLDLTIPSSAPTSSTQTNDTLTVCESTPKSKTTFSCARPNTALDSTKPSSPSALTIQTSDTLPVSKSIPTHKTAFSSARPNTTLNSTTPSSHPAQTIQIGDTLAESTSPSKTAFSSAHENPELPSKSAARNPLPPAFSGSRGPDLPLLSTSFNESTPVGRNFQSSSADQPTALPNTALSSPSIVIPESQGKKSKRAFYKNKVVATKFHKAVEKGRVEVVRRLLEEKVNVNAHGREGMTAAHLAAMRGDAVILELLLRDGAQVQRCDWYGWQALHWAAKRDRSGRCVGLLLEAGASPGARTRPEGNMPLHLAALEGNEAAAAELLRAGAKISVRNNHGKTPLDLAPASGQMRKMLGAE